MKHNILNESLIVYGNNYLEKRGTTHLLTGHIPTKEKGDSILELQDDKSEESPEAIMIVSLMPLPRNWTEIDVT